MITDGGGGTYQAPTTAQIDSVGALLGLVTVDPQTIAGIKSILEQSRDDIPVQGLPETPADVFGGSSTAAQLGHHTSLAHQHVVKAMIDMLEGVNGFEVGLDAFVDDFTKTDENAGVWMNQIRSGVEKTVGCTTGPADPAGTTSSTLPQCTTED